MDLLVPPRRLGRLLSGARLDHGLTLEEASAALDGLLGVDDLLDVELARREVTDEELEAIADLYGIETSTMVPARGELVIDLDEGVIVAGGGKVELASEAEIDDVLSRYLALVFAMRDVSPGTTVPLRLDDVVVLADALGMEAADVEDRLGELMEVRPEPVRKRLRLLRGRVLVPAVGVLVTTTACGPLVMIPGERSNAAPVRGSDTPAVAGELPAARIGDALVQERNADGTPGPETVRNG
ncbi:MAG: hypothetical protein ACOYOP_10485 [Microthrixaceae bacterium]